MKSRESAVTFSVVLLALLLGLTGCSNPAPKPAGYLLEASFAGGLAGLLELDDARTRSISAENLFGRPGQGAAGEQFLTAMLRFGA